MSALPVGMTIDLGKPCQCPLFDAESVNPVCHGCRAYPACESARNLYGVEAVGDED